MNGSNMKTFARISLSAFLACLALSTSLLAAESLAPPHAPIVDGKPVPVVAHPDQRRLLESAMPALAANKTLVYDYWRNIIVAGNANDVPRYLATDYIEHNPMLPTGASTFQEYVAGKVARKTAPGMLDDLVTIAAEGPYVVLAFVSHYLEPDNTGATYTSTQFELFRVEDGRIAEHWDSQFRVNQKVPDYGAQQALPVAGVTGLAQHAQLDNEDAALFANKRLAFDLWRQIPEGGREELADLYLDPLYIQHNPNAATGIAGFKEYMARRPDGEVESWLETPLVAMVAEGDLVVQVLETTRELDGMTYHIPWFDMFRIEGNRIIEHWDTAAKGEIPAPRDSGPLGL
jgi:predicted SnoaL-like aldol condensation-catalyzing enzyme